MDTTRHREDYFTHQPAIFYSGVGKNYVGSFDVNDYEDISFSGSSTHSTTTRSMDDVPTPNYLARIARGDIINSPMQSVRTVYTHPVPTNFERGHVDFNDNDQFWGASWTGTNTCPDTYFGSFLKASNSPEVAATVASKVDMAVQQAHANVSLSQIASLTVAAEANKTVSSMASIMGRLLRILRAAKRLDVKYLKKQISRSELLDRYMELRYAIRPLMYDARNLVTAIESSKAFQEVRATARGGGSYSYDDESEEIAVPYSSGYTFDRRKTVHYQANIRAGVLYAGRTDTIKVWGVDQPIEAVWEAIPFSFIADWFFNIAHVLSAWSPNPGVTELASWVSTEIIEYSETNVDGFKNVGTYRHLDYFNWSGVTSFLTETKSRQVNPNLSFLPGVKIRLDNFKLLDLIAIGRNLFR